MWKNIMGQAIWQIIVLGLILFKGEVIFGVPSSRGHAEEYHPETAVHYTIFFQVFVMLQLFNEVNARKLKPDEFNVFEGFFNNSIFLIVFFGTLIIQFVLVEFGGRAVKVTPLTIDQYFICFLIGMSSLGVGYLVKKIPDGLIEKIQFFKETEVEAVDPTTIQGMMKRPSTLLRKKKHIEKEFAPASGSKIKS